MIIRSQLLERVIRVTIGKPGRRTKSDQTVIGILKEKNRKYIFIQKLVRPKYICIYERKDIKSLEKLPSDEEIIWKLKHGF